MGWSWVWTLAPVDNGKTRLVVRLRIQPTGPDNPVLGTVIGASAFVMEKGMLVGLQQRAEGSPAPGPNEPLEIALWLLALLAGLVSTVLFIIQRQWLPPLAVGLLAVVVLLVFTYVQPAVWLRAVTDLALVVGAVVARRK